MVPSNLIAHNLENSSPIWWKHTEIMPSTLPEWANYFSTITQDINQKNGTINCAHCALRTNEYLALGFTPEQPPVPKGDAKLYTQRTYKDLNAKSKRKKQTECLRAFCEDKRLTDQCLAYVNDGSIEDLSEDITIIDLEPEILGNTPNKSIRFLKADKDDLLHKLLELPRRAKDSSGYGFILVTSTRNVGHIINYFITPNNEVFFLDAQQKNQNARVTTTTNFLNYYRPEIFYINANPPEGFKIKQEYSTNNLNTVHVFVKTEALESKENAEPDIALFEQQRAFLNEQPSLSELLPDAQKPLTLQDKNSASINYNEMAVAAAQANHRDSVMELLTNPLNPNPDYNTAAVEAAKCGHSDLVLELLRISSNKTPDYNSVAVEAIKCGHKNLTLELLRDKRNTNTIRTYSDVAYNVTAKGDQAFLLELLNDIPNELCTYTYNDAAITAAGFGHKDLTLTLLKDKRSTALAYKRIAYDLANKGDQAFLLEFLNHAPMELLNDTSNEIDCCNRLAKTAAVHGHSDLVLALLTSPLNKKPDYDIVGSLVQTYLYTLNIQENERHVKNIEISAAKNGHSKFLFRLLSVRKYDTTYYNVLATAAAEHGHTDLVIALLEDPFNQAPDYQKIVTIAIQGEHSTLMLELNKLLQQKTQAMEQGYTPYRTASTAQVQANKRTAEVLESPPLEKKEQAEQAMSETVSITYPLSTLSNTISDRPINTENDESDTKRQKTTPL